MTTNKKRRLMCEVVFTEGKKEARAVGRKLRAAGFEFIVSNHPEDVDECSDVTKFGMIWKDYAANVDARLAVREFEAGVEVACPNCADSIGFVDPEHTPTRYTDFGEYSAEIDALNRWALPGLEIMKGE